MYLTYLISLQVSMLEILWQEPMGGLGVDTKQTRDVVNAH